MAPGEERSCGFGRGDEGAPCEVDMATRRRNDTGSRRSGRSGRRRPAGRSGSSGVLWLEIGGALALGVILIVIFSGKEGNPPPRKAPAPAPAVKETPKYTPPPVSKSYDYLKRPGKKPDRPAPKVDLTQGRKWYQQALTLWNQSIRERKNSSGNEARETLHKAYRLLERALKSVDEFNLWVEEADWKDWEIDGEAMKAKREVDKWLKLQSRIHKILPQAEK